METAENKYITVAYKLYTTEDGKRDLVEETAVEHPLAEVLKLLNHR